MTMYKWTGSAGDSRCENPENWDPHGVPSFHEIDFDGFFISESDIQSMTTGGSIEFCKRGRKFELRCLDGKQHPPRVRKLITLPLRGTK